MCAQVSVTRFTIRMNRVSISSRGCNGDTKPLKFDFVTLPTYPLPLSGLQNAKTTYLPKSLLQGQRYVGRNCPKSRWSQKVHHCLPRWFHIVCAGRKKSWRWRGARRRGSPQRRRRWRRTELDCGRQGPLQAARGCAAAEAVAEGHVGRSLEQACCRGQERRGVFRASGVVVL